MCIRDRAFPEAFRSLTLDGAEIVAVCANYEVDENAQWRACLLYTSDAADERSSVDLGGRRIIKKKKTQDIKGGVSTQENGEYTHT